MKRRPRDARHFGQAYARERTPPEVLRVEREVAGGNVGVQGYTTVAQADALIRRIGLGRGMRVLDVGAGRGWPGLYLARKTGCDAVLTDVPLAGVRSAHRRAAGTRHARRIACAVASAAHLPFRPRTFDAVVHTDVLC